MTLTLTKTGIVHDLAYVSHVIRERVEDEIEEATQCEKKPCRKLFLSVECDTIPPDEIDLGDISVEVEMEDGDYTWKKRRTAGDVLATLVKFSNNHCLYRVEW